MLINKTAIVIAGPTGAGKTAVAIELARHFNTEIISADSRQCYKELSIGVARPSIQELAQATHHFIASHSIYENVNAAGFERYSMKKANEIFRKKDVLVIVGGTGLYIKAFCEGLDEVPAIPEEIHRKVKEQYAQQGLKWLQHEVDLVDPEFYKHGEMQNPYRLLRALEVFRTAGISINVFKKGQPKMRPFKIIKIALDLPKEVLHQNINDRVNTMIKSGLEDEVRSLLSAKELTALQTVGYKEMFDFIKKKTSLALAVESIKLHTRQYAKRQLTWFRKDPEFQWIKPDAGEIIKYVN